MIALLPYLYCLHTAHNKYIVRGKSYEYERQPTTNTMVQNGKGTTTLELCLDKRGLPQYKTSGNTGYIHYNTTYIYIYIHDQNQTKKYKTKIY